MNDEGGESASPTSALLGKLISGRYLIEKQLGRGGFAVTYLARDNQLHNRPVVIKALLDYQADDPWALRKFRQEAEALARINHPGVVGPLDFGQLPDSRPFLVMEFIQGQRLRDALDPRGMVLSRAAAILRQVGRALTAAHEQGIFHRDVKPENIMLQSPGDDEQAKLIDFGIANVSRSEVPSSGSTRVAGTFGYIAPEQYEGQPFSVASDEYAMGVVAYEMLTGRHPFNAESEAHMIRMQLHGVPLKPRALRSGLPEAAEECLLRALAVSPAERFPRPRDFGDALAAALQAEEGSARRSHPRETLGEQPLEIGHVLLMDIVKYALLPIDQQHRTIELLQKVVRETAEFRKAEQQRQLIPLPAGGDSIGLVFFGDPRIAVSCAVSIATALRAHPNLPLRIGLNTGPMYRMLDIRDATNVAGAGVDQAQRVMSCAQAGEILLSRSLAEIIANLADWRSRLEDLGEREVKHGARVHLFRLNWDAPAAAPPSARPEPIPAPVAVVAEPESVRDSAPPAARPDANRIFDFSPPEPPAEAVAFANWDRPKPVRSRTRNTWIRALAALLVIGTGFGVYRLTRPPPPNLGGIADPGGDSQKGKATPQVAQPESKVSPGDVPVREVKADVPSGLRYVLVPAGHGNVGISPGETPTTDAPWHDFETAGFWLGETEVTVAAYRKFAVDTQRPLPQPPIIAGKAFNPEWQLRDLPMVMVDWQDASDFCKWDGGRLPGEFEWEYGGRAGSAAPAYGPMDEIGWFADNSGPAPFDATQLWNGEARKAWVRYEALVVARGSTIHPVAQKKPNGFGLFDMLGNVAEWTADSFRDGGMEKSIRGSAWGFTGPSRVSLRDRYAPTMRNGYLGFRCAIDPRR